MIVMTKVLADSVRDVPYNLTRIKTEYLHLILLNLISLLYLIDQT